MSVAALLEELRDHGIAVWTDGPWLEWSGPPGAMTADLECRLAEQKAQLLALPYFASERQLDLKAVDGVSMHVLIDRPGVERTMTELIIGPTLGDAIDLTDATIRSLGQGSAVPLEKQLIRMVPGVSQNLFKSRDTLFRELGLER